MPAPQLTNTLHDHAFVRDPLWLQFDAPNWSGIGVGTAAVAVITFDTAVDAHETITVSFGTTVLEFECVVGADDSGLQFEQSGTATGSATAFETALLTNAIISRWYTVTRSGAVVTITARKSGPAYSLTVLADPITIFSGVVYTAGDLNATTPNYRVALRVWTNIAGVVELAAVPDGLSAARFNISDVLNVPALVTGTWAPPALANALPTDFNSIAWWAEVFEVFGDPATEHQLRRIGSSTSPKTAWWATMRFEERQHTQTFLTKCLTTGGAPGLHPFWTWRGRQAKRFTSTTEKHVLGWLWWDNGAADYTELKMMARVHCKSGTVIGWSQRYAASGDAALMEQGKLTLWATGYTELNIAALVPSGDECVKYEVRISNADNEVSETFTFHMAPDDYNELQIQFFNSLGIQETMRCTGQWALGAEADPEILQQTLGIDPVAGSSERIQNVFGADETLEFSTGFVKRWELYALAEVLTSRAVRWYDAERDRIYNLVLDKPSTRIVSRGTGDELLFALNLRALVADPVQAFSLPKTLVS